MAIISALSVNTINIETFKIECNKYIITPPFILSFQGLNENLNNELTWPISNILPGFEWI